MKKIIKESELKNLVVKIYKEEQEKILQEKWDNLSKEDKIFVVEFGLISLIFDFYKKSAV